MVQTISVGGLFTDVPIHPRTEPDWSRRYQVPRRPDRRIAQVMSGRVLHHTVEALDLDRAAHEVLVWSERWFAEDLAGLVCLIQTAKASPRPPTRYGAPPQDEVPSVSALHRAIDGLVLDDAARRIVRWAESWRPRDLAGLVSLVDAARSARGTR
jgi:hypothetical protein